MWSVDLYPLLSLYHACTHVSCVDLQWFNYGIVNINRSIVMIPFRRKDLLLASAVRVELESLTKDSEVHVCNVSLPQSHGLRKMWVIMCRQHTGYTRIRWSITACNVNVICTLLYSCMWTHTCTVPSPLLSTVTGQDQDALYIASFLLMHRRGTHACMYDIYPLSSPESIKGSCL